MFQVHKLAKLAIIQWFVVISLGKFVTCSSEEDENWAEKWVYVTEIEPAEEEEPPQLFEPLTEISEYEEFEEEDSSDYSEIAREQSSYIDILSRKFRGGLEIGESSGTKKIQWPIDNTSRTVEESSCLLSILEEFYDNDKKRSCMDAKSCKELAFFYLKQSPYYSVMKNDYSKEYYLYLGGQLVNKSVNSPQEFLENRKVIEKETEEGSPCCPRRRSRKKDGRLIKLETTFGSSSESAIVRAFFYEILFDEERDSYKFQYMIHIEWGTILQDPTFGPVEYCYDKYGLKNRDGARTT